MPARTFAFGLIGIGLGLLGVMDRASRKALPTLGLVVNVAMVALFIARWCSIRRRLGVDSSEQLWRDGAMNDTCDLPRAPTAPSGADCSTSAEPRPWGFWASLGWGLLVFPMEFFAAVVCAIVWMLTHRHHFPDISDPAFSEITTSIMFAAGMAPLGIAVRYRRQSLRDYFALNGVPRRDFLLGLAALVAIGLVSYIIQLSFEIDSGSAVVAAEYGEAKLAGVLPALWLSSVIVAPITEELMFRGFLHPAGARPGSVSWVRSC